MVGTSRSLKLFTAVLFSTLIIFTGKGFAEERLQMATTTSTENSGLLASILPPFEKMFNLKVDVIAVGTGKAMKLGETGDVDVIFVHDPMDEERFIVQGYGVNRRNVMHNDFVLVGPPGDPAGCKGVKNIIEVFSKIARANALFVSRGDDSGTHRKEKEVWAKAGIAPQRKWYM